MRDKPLVSIVTPSYNQGRFIEDTILSVKNQDYPNIEHIVVDGGSTDNTLDILKKYEGTYNMRWISEPDEGQSDAINKGFRMAKGEIIGWLNSDDVYFTRDVISYVVKRFKKFPHADFIYGNCAYIDVDNNIFRVLRRSQRDYNKLFRGFSLSQPASFTRRKVILKNKLDKNLHFTMDFEFWLRVGRKCNFMYVDKILAASRVHRHRKTISGKDKLEVERRTVMRKYGLKFDLKYYILRYFFDFPDLMTRKVFGIVDILKIQKNLDNLDLAFRGKCDKNKLNLIYSQTSPEFMLKL